MNLIPKLSCEYRERLKEECKRLIEVRESLGISPDDFSTLTGYCRQMDAGYGIVTSELDMTVLSIVAQIGADVLYVVTGERSLFPLSSDESRLLTAYRQSSNEDKARITSLLPAPVA